MKTAKPIKSYLKSRFPRAVSVYGDARRILLNPSLGKVFSEIYRTNAWQDPESVSGRGSTLGRTKVIMAQLPMLLQELNAKSILDAACGDFNWMKHIDLSSVDYIGVDVVPEVIDRNRHLYQNDRRTFMVLDITTDRLPNSDVILCRDCFIHLSFRRARAALQNLRTTGATYLLCTTHTAVQENVDCTDGSWRSLNLQLPPFNFPPPRTLMVEDPELSKCLGVWPLGDL